MPAPHRAPGMRIPSRDGYPRAGQVVLARVGARHCNVPVRAVRLLGTWFAAVQGRPMVLHPVVCWRPGPKLPEALWTRGRFDDSIAWLDKRMVRS